MTVNRDMGQQVGQLLQEYRVEVERNETRMAGVLVGVAQHCLKSAAQLAARGARSKRRELTRSRIRVARQAADDAQVAVNEEIAPDVFGGDRGQAA